MICSVYGTSCTTNNVIKTSCMAVNLHILKTNFDLFYPNPKNVKNTISRTVISVATIWRKNRITNQLNKSFIPKKCQNNNATFLSGYRFHSSTTICNLKRFRVEKSHSGPSTLFLEPIKHRLKHTEANCVLKLHFSPLFSYRGWIPMTSLVFFYK